MTEIERQAHLMEWAALFDTDLEEAVIQERLVHMLLDSAPGRPRVVLMGVLSWLIKFGRRQYRGEEDFPDMIKGMLEAIMKLDSSTKV